MSSESEGSEQQESEFLLFTLRLVHKTPLPRASSTETLFNTVNKNLDTLFDKDTGWYAYAAVPRGCRHKPELLIEFQSRMPYSRTNFAQNRQRLCQMLCSPNQKTALNKIAGCYSDKIRYMLSTTEDESQKAFNTTFIETAVKCLADATLIGMTDSSENAYASCAGSGEVVSEVIRYVYIDSIRVLVTAAQFTLAIRPHLEGLLPIFADIGIRLKPEGQIQAGCCLDFVKIYRTNSQALYNLADAVVRNLGAQDSGSTQSFDGQKLATDVVEKTETAIAEILHLSELSAQDRDQAIYKKIQKRLNEPIELASNAAGKAQLKSKSFNMPIAGKLAGGIFFVVLTIGILALNPILSPIALGVGLDSGLCGFVSSFFFGWACFDISKRSKADQYRERFLGLIDTLVKLQIYLSIVESKLSPTNSTSDAPENPLVTERMLEVFEIVRGNIDDQSVQERIKKEIKEAKINLGSIEKLIRDQYRDKHSPAPDRDAYPLNSLTPSSSR